MLSMYLLVKSLDFKDMTAEGILTVVNNIYISIEIHLIK